MTETPTKAPINVEYELVPIQNLQKHPRNVNQGDTGAIYQSIEANGFYGALVVQKGTGYILAGNHRYDAAVQSGFTEVPVTWLDVDDDRAERLRMSRN